MRFRQRSSALAMGVLAGLTLTACSGIGTTTGRSVAEPTEAPDVPNMPTQGPSTTTGEPYETIPGAPSPTFFYVALGDSYTAAPGVGVDSGAGGCYHSDRNYPHLIAAADPRIGLIDNSCSGAKTSDVLTTQIDALDADTDLVTLGIGGNDEDLFSRVVPGCISLAVNDPDGSPCTDIAGNQIATTVARIQANIGSVLDAITDAAPHAKVLVISYPDLLPDSGTCPDLIPIATGDYPLIDTVNLLLARAMKAEARERGLIYVDVYGASMGHDVCSRDPWINGQRTAPDGTTPFHPFASEQAAVAAMISRFL